MNTKITKFNNFEVVETILASPGRGEITFEVVIKINGKTRIKDIKNAWGKIKKIQKRLVDYKKINKEELYRERDRRIIELKIQKNTSQDIAAILRNEPPGFDVDPGHVRKIISRKGEEYGYKKNRDVLEVEEV